MNPSIDEFFGVKTFDTFNSDDWVYHWLSFSCELLNAYKWVIRTSLEEINWRKDKEKRTKEQKNKKKSQRQKKNKSKSKVNLFKH